MKKSIIFVLLALLGITSCEKYEPQYEGPYSDTGNPNNPQGSGKVYEILSLENGVVNLYTSILSDRKTLQNLPPGIWRASINFAHDRIAYQVPGEEIVIIDSSGTTIATVSGSAGAAWFDWHANNQTLYYLAGSQLFTHGPAIPGLAEDYFANVVPFGVSDLEIGSACVLADGSVLVGYRYYTWSGYETEIRRFGADGSDLTLGVPSYNTVSWMRCDKAGTQLYFGSANGPSVQTYHWDLSQGYFTEEDFTELAAPAPDGQANVSWESNLYVAFLSGSYFSADPKPSNVEALDW